MSKIEKWRTAKAKADELRRFAEDIHNGRCDKLHVRSVQIEEVSYGFFGNSSTRGAGKSVLPALEDEVKKKIRSLAKSAADRAEARAEEARKEAEEEAREILGEIGA